MDFSLPEIPFSLPQSPDTLQWQNDYLQGTGCEMYTETLSPTFTGMTFSQASELCFVKLKLLLLAIEVKTDGDNDSKISINPRGTKLPSSTVGFFIAQSAEEVKRCVKMFDPWTLDAPKNIDIEMMFAFPSGRGSTARRATRASRTRRRSRSASAKTVSWPIPPCSQISALKSTLRPSRVLIIKIGHEKKLAENCSDRRDDPAHRPQEQPHCAAGSL